VRRTCFELLRDIAFEAGVITDYSITSFSDTTLRAQLLSYLNRAKAAAVRKCNFEILTVVKNIETLASYATGTVTIAVSDTTVTGSGTTFTAAMAGRKIQIGSDTNSYQIIKFTDTTHLEIDRPYTGTAQSAASYKIYQDIYAIPPTIGEIVDIRRSGTSRELDRKSLSFINSRYPDPLMASGEPWCWALFDELLTREPVSTTYAADTSTSTTAIIESTLTSAAIQDYYKDWYVYNTTRSASSKVKSYDAPSTTLTLETPITGQVATDTFYLTKRELRITFGPAPLVNYNFLVTGLRDSSLFVNDADYEQEIDADYEDGLVYQALAEFYKPRDEKRAAIYESQASALWAELSAFNSSEKSSRSRFTGGRDNIPRIMAYGDKLSYRE
jgi:hypothetical protein